MPGVFIGSTELTTVGDIKIGGTDVQEVYVGSTKVFPTGGGSGPLPLPDIPNLQLHFDAKDASSLTLTGSVVDAWADKSGNGFDVANAGSVAAPVYVTSGIEYVLFDGSSNGYLSSAAITGITVDVGTWAVVFQQASAASEFISSLSTGPTGNRTRIITNVSPGIELHASGLIAYSVSLGGDQTITAVIGDFDLATSLTITDDEEATDSVVAATTANSNPDTLTIGGRGNNTAIFRGSIHEVLYYSRRLDASEKASLFDYFASRWQTTITFVPTDIPDIEFWFDADDAATLSLTGNVVDAWSDKGGAGRTLTNAGSATAPIYNTAGFAAVEFPATSLGYLENNAISGIAVGGGTWVIVSDYGFGGTTFVANLSFTPTGNRTRVQSTTNGDLTGLANTLSATNAGTGDRVATIVDYDVTTSLTITDDKGVTDTTAGSAVAQSDPDNLTVGGRGGGTSLFNGKVHEVIYYSRRITGSEKVQLFDYLRAKWGL